MEEWITVKEAAKIKKCTERNVIELIRKGSIEAKKDGRKWLVLIDTAEMTAEFSPQISEIISVLKVQLEEKDNQIKEKDKQILSLQEQLSGASQRHDTIVLQLTRQLGDAQRALEYHKVPWWKRLKSGKRNDDNKG